MPEHRFGVSYMVDGRFDDNDDELLENHRAAAAGRTTVSTTVSGSGFSYGNSSSFTLLVSSFETSEIGCKEFDGMEKFC